MARLSVLAGLVAGVSLGCASDLQVPTGATPKGTLVIEPLPRAGVTSRSIRITTDSVEIPRLFQRALSERQVKNVRSGELAESLRDSEVPLSTRQAFDGGAEPTTRRDARLWIPDELLRPSEEYTLLTDNRVINFSTLSDEVVLSRMWPREAATSNALFCLEGERWTPLADPDGLLETALIAFGNDQDAGVLAYGRGWASLAHSPPCWFWTGESGQINDPLVGHPVALQPTMPAPMVNLRPESPSCRAGETALSWGCVAAEDDRISIRGGDVASLWLTDNQSGAWFVLEPGSVGVVRGLSPERWYEIDVRVYFPDSAPLEQTISVETTPARPRIVINEVFADPLGSESTQEWIELYNDGISPMSLEGWRLEDEGGSVNLPAAWIAPGGYAMLVNDTYDTTTVSDPVPEPNVSLVRLPSLTKSGLSNSGETLRLVDKWDMLVSTYPGTPKPTPGVSVARGAPWQVDGDAAAFGLHAEPGASPGAPNVRRAASGQIQ